LLEIAMESQRVLISLITKDNDYQREQAAAAERTAAKLGLTVEIVYAGGDAITQSQQLLEAIQTKPEKRPQAIILSPAGTALQQVAIAAAKTNIGWVVLSLDADYIASLRGLTSAPVFAVSSDHLEIGRLQGRQLARLLPEGGEVLYVQGPSTSSAARQRTQGAMETKHKNVHLRLMTGQWTETSAYQAALSFLRLRTSHDARIDMVAAHNDAMAIGVRKALKETTKEWSGVPFIGVDGLASTGQRWVQEGLLSATIVVPTTTDIALAMLKHALLTKSQPREVTFTAPKSHPDLDKLAPSKRSDKLHA
jgi:ABC-type sugar transport system substrate-binding protein